MLVLLMGHPVVNWFALIDATTEVCRTGLHTLAEVIEEVL